MPRIHNIFPEQFPEPLASDWGEDAYGLFQAFTYKGVRQGFRWIEPGIFLMGSPEHEPERWEDELLHEVRLSKGFWLGETTVSQALWLAVSTKGSIRFVGDFDYPVGWESNFWKIQEWIARLNELTDGLLYFRLPTEAEWEYACRAGTSTPYWCGAEISATHANYNSNSLENKERQGVEQNKILPVRSLMPNPLGLFHMHGNVWEWCSDWYGDYPQGPVIDPCGPEAGVDRVLRGGSWESGGGLCRSAARLKHPSFRSNSGIGFRLVQGR